MEIDDIRSIKIQVADGGYIVDSYNENFVAKNTSVFVDSSGLLLHIMNQLDICDYVIRMAPDPT